MHTRLRLAACSLAFCAGFPQSLLAQPAIPSDLDEDGIPDDLEAELIERHTPLLQYSYFESYWPSTLEWFVENSALYYCNDDTLIFTRAQLRENPLRALQGTFDPAPGAECDAAGVVTSNAQLTPGPGETQFSLDLDDSARTGMGPLAVGMYAHVVRVSGPIERSCGTVLQSNREGILVQYWQFFPHNPSAGLCPSHEGDWLRLDVYVDAAPPYDLKVILYDPHGSRNADRCLSGNDLPVDGVPIVWLESGAHEWWPQDVQSPLEQCVTPDGDGLRIRPAFVPNLGERWAPLCSWDEQAPTDTLLALFFNGQWGEEGSNPGGPGTKSADIFPAPNLFPVRYLHPNPPNGAGVFTSPEFAEGSRYFPLGSLESALRPLGQGGIQPNGVILAHAGTYPGPATIQRPVTIRAIGGSAVFGTGN